MSKRIKEKEEYHQQLSFITNRLRKSENHRRDLGKNNGRKVSLFTTTKTDTMV
jgi:hypothetical protein